MASGWTDERRQKQREAIQRWKPWERSTGPRTKEGKARSAANGKGSKPSTANALIRLTQKILELERLKRDCQRSPSDNKVTRLLQVQDFLRQFEDF